MQIELNGEPHQVSEATTMRQLIEELGLAERRIAIEVNADVLPRSRHDDYQLRPGDRIEIVHAIGGG